MRLAVCVANDDARQALAETIGQVLIDKRIPFSLRTYRRFRDVLYEIEDNTPLNVLILGVQHADTAKEQLSLARTAGFDGKVVLVSDTNAFAVSGYDWGVDGYVVWPAEAGRIEALLERLAHSLVRACLTVRSNRAVHHVPFDRIVCVESRNSKCILHRDDGLDMVIYCRLDTVEEQLCDERFLRCHQSYLINMDHVVCADKEFVLSGGVCAAIRQRDLKSMRDRYRAYDERRRDAAVKI